MHGCLTKAPPKTCFCAEPHGLFLSEYQPWAYKAAGNFKGNVFSVTTMLITIGPFNYYSTFQAYANITIVLHVSMLRLFRL